MKLLYTLTLGIGTLFIAVSCTKTVGKDPALVPTTVNVCDSVKYSTTIQPILTANCATPGCHVSGGSGPGDFTSYADVSSSVSSGSFKARVINGNPSFMPITGRLPDADIEKIQCWLSAGAPNN